MTSIPSQNGCNGRDSTGRFAKGNRGGPGNPNARRVADIRKTLMAAVSDDDLVEIAHVLVQRAKRGDVYAAREVLDRLMGKSKATVAVETEPSISVKEAQTEIRTIYERRPDLLHQAAELAGMRLLPAEAEPPPKNENVTAQ